MAHFKQPFWLSRCCDWLLRSPCCWNFEAFVWCDFILLLLFLFFIIFFLTYPILQLTSDIEKVSNTFFFLINKPILCLYCGMMINLLVATLENHFGSLTMKHRNTLNLTHRNGLILQTNMYNETNLILKLTFLMPNEVSFWPKNAVLKYYVSLAYGTV